MMLASTLRAQLHPEDVPVRQPPYTMKTFSARSIGQKYPGMFGIQYRRRSGKPSRQPGDALRDKLCSGMTTTRPTDGTLIWWDPNAPGKTETGVDGNGLFGTSTTASGNVGSFPMASSWFDPNNTVTIFDSLPGPDKPPSYPYACYYLCGSPGP